MEGEFEFVFMYVFQTAELIWYSIIDFKRPVGFCILESIWMTEEAVFLLLTSSIISLCESFQYAKLSWKFASLGSQSYSPYVYYDEKNSHIKKLITAGKQNLSQLVFH